MLWPLLLDRGCVEGVGGALKCVYLLDNIAGGLGAKGCRDEVAEISSEIVPCHRLQGLDTGQQLYNQADKGEGMEGVGKTDFVLTANRLTAERIVRF